eukprot:NODE_382_length_1778_cov_81.098901_g282_i0.p1 GENE.NODE_382_length_1778_cov_81.098901_g282_i0~~NODE_382_length_1778_cov_81.098901_g282_i0.p1  ORF type:complete len:469 (+),score=88.86 NODE_382_length_1778_cov_81.098901_g282_i0:61-1407(+)
MDEWAMSPNHGGNRMNGYNNIVKAPTVIQPVPHGQDEIVSIECPPVVEYTHHFTTIEQLEAYYESVKYVPIQRPSENFIFTESADNYILNADSCPFCGRFFPSAMGALDRGRHSFKICPYRPVKCSETGKVMMAKDFLYLHMWTIYDNEEQAADNRAGVWAWTNSQRRGSQRPPKMNSEWDAYPPMGSMGSMGSPSQPSFEMDDRSNMAETNARLWEDATEAIARREKLALMELEQRALLREHEVELERLKEREARIEALEREKEAQEALRRERSARRFAEERVQQAEESARVWEEATDVLARREADLLRDTENIRESGHGEQDDKRTRELEQALKRAESYARQKEREAETLRRETQKGDGGRMEAALDQERRAREQAERARDELEKRLRYESEMRLEAEQRSRQFGKQPQPWSADNRGGPAKRLDESEVYRYRRSTSPTNGPPRASF